MSYHRVGKNARKWDRKSVLADEIWMMPRKKQDVLRAIICCPAPYASSMSSLGMWTLFRLIHDHPCFSPERVVSNWPRQSLDGQHRPSKGALFAFSINWEMGFPEMVRILRENGIPLKTQDRRDSDPIVVAGGIAVTMNPYPLLPFCDLIVLGDGEEVVGLIMDRLQDCIGQQRERIWSRLDGVPGTLLAASSSGNNLVNRTENLEEYPTGPGALSPRAELGMSFLLEMSRGCDRGCYFCGVSHWKRPARHRSLQTLRASLPSSLSRDVSVGLIGASAGDHPELKKILHWLHSMGCKLCLPSLRPDQIDGEIAVVLAECGLRSVSLGVEAGSDDMRRRIGKHLTNDIIFHASELLTRSGIKNIKVYLLYGLPGESMEDLDRAVQLLTEIRRIQHSIQGDKAGKLTLSANPFVPKNGTPFSEEKLLPVQDWIERRKRLQKAMAQRGIGFGGESPRWARLQAIFSKGGQELADVFVQMAQGVPGMRALKAMGWKV